MQKAYHLRAHAEVLHRIGDPRAAAHERSAAQKREATAAAVLQMPAIARPSTHGGEMALYDYRDPDDRYVGLHVLDTLRNPGMMAAQASLERDKLLLELGGL